jgi:hypothetical protein
MKKYIPVKETEYATHIKIELRYNLGGISWATYQPEKRGYYLHVTPVKRETRDGYALESFTAFTGYKQLVKEVTRKSVKAEAAAEAAAADILDIMVERVCRKNDLELAQEVQTA